MAGKRAFGTNAAYVASKHGMVGFAHSIFEDVRAHNIKVCAICPGFVNAGASRTMDVPPETFAQFIQPDDVAQTVQFVLTFPNTACPTEILLSPQQALINP
jgi:NADP-dependent 3-hydroxy acid dehydrogenase YdfG